MTVIDLFAGCGGLSLGFEMAGFDIPLAIERDEWAAQTYKKNHANTAVITEDITKIKKLNGLVNKKVHGIIGGPPCQGFSLCGDRDENDPRNSLFMEFVRFVKFYTPEFFVMENVTGILSMKTKSNELVKNVISKKFDKLGYTVKIHKLNAADFGVPQSRVRVFFVGIRSGGLHFEIPSLISEKNYVSINDAIMDLPEIDAGGGAEIMEYTKKPGSKYQKWAREKSKVLHNHVAMRHTQRLVERFKTIKQGQSVADVAAKHQQRKRGNAEIVSGKVYSQNNMRPYGDKPSPTVAASFQSNFIHPHYDRNYTAREAARLQSFPDDYIFCGKRTTMSWEKNLSQYQQIGNAVPPLLANGIASLINDYFK